MLLSSKVLLHCFWNVVLWNFLLSFNATKSKPIILYIDIISYKNLLLLLCLVFEEILLISVLFYSIRVINKMMPYLFLCHFLSFFIFPLQCCWQMIWYGLSEPAVVVLCAGCGSVCASCVLQCRFTLVL